ncbi:hypothetical protein [Stigmatella aurantiaca]|uniref:Uncharacterized protein n=1 Tax=Stigmatella aurantiaca (strain DW4/3-1) TaxID=378806 RepID=Q08RL9_STIAD|nr:hypothetical protein [Stigmatella aurantiaca]ADO68796.1 uncharacterized protein STAUR_0992 [Stigmatella aurantiaca DW4/3-1]EAU63146.1 conserved hypothetical protein [Stigmatella aurantiaca DW4/3-1]
MRTGAFLAVVAVLGWGGLWGCQGKGVALKLDMDPPSVTPSESQAFSGQVRGVEPSLTLNGTPVALQEGRFELTQPLKDGANVFTFVLSAKPGAGAAAEQKTDRFEVKRVPQDVYDAEYFYSTSGSMNGTQRSGSGGLLADKAESRLRADELSGSRLEQYSHENRPPRGGMPLDISLSVGQGRVKVSVKPEQGPVASAVASPNAPATLQAPAELHHSKYTVRLEALDGKPARQLELQVRY